MNYLILVRHGQSIWNLEKRFTGWVDIDLTDKGKFEAEKAGILIKERKISLDLYYSSYQKRANNTLKIIMLILTTQMNCRDSLLTMARQQKAMVAVEENKEQVKHLIVLVMTVTLLVISLIKLVSIN